MWEFTISINSKYKHYLKYILSEIKHAKLDVISVISSDECTDSLTMAISVVSMQRLANILVECICNIILLVFKKDYYNSKLDLNKLDNASKSAFLKALVMFDSISDKQEIKQEIILNKSINIDSFYYFRLPFIREKWSGILDIISCSNYMSSTENFLELLKFLINNLDTSIPLINIYFKNNRFMVYDNKNKLIKLKEHEDSEEINLITQIIELSPKIINLYCSENISKDTFNVMYYLFDKKINLIK